MGLTFVLTTHLSENSITCHNEDDADYGTIEKDHKETDLTYQPSTPTVTSEDEEMSNIVLSTMNQLSQSSPVHFAVKRKYVNDLSPYTLSYIKRKWNGLLEGAKDQFFEAIAPGQGKMLCDLLHQGSDNSVPNDLQILIEKYKDCDSLSHMVILSLVDHDKYSRADIMNYFPGCTKYQVDRGKTMEQRKYISSNKRKA